jgi:hypothetical protein
MYSLANGSILDIQNNFQQEILLLTPAIIVFYFGC